MLCLWNTASQSGHTSTLNKETWSSSHAGTHVRDYGTLRVADLDQSGPHVSYLCRNLEPVYHFFKKSDLDKSRSLTLTYFCYVPYIDTAHGDAVRVPPPPHNRSRKKYRTSTKGFLWLRTSTT